ncbi:DnaJ-like subfamily C member 8 [Holothuria leucospilota]|uniref:DnaJ-like subfamily C member 8 n=1 Tax=Holothuria leucospilota TaxID=206669 RepID=A0A9Q1BAE6_HOLLE|nr:DnaJ-like subfamily C member 8 [Holothuria leucospilota]
MASSSDAKVTPTDSNFDNFISEVKAIEKRDSVLTPKMQIERLLRPGSTYFNLNPFEVLQVEPSMKIEDIKKKYRKLSILVHPDKNVDDKERAQTAFEAVSKAMRTLEDEAERKKCLDIIEEAKLKAQHEVRWHFSKDCFQIVFFL